MVLILGPPKRYITTSAVAFINGQFVCSGAHAGVETPGVDIFLLKNYPHFHNLSIFFVQSRHGRDTIYTFL